MKKKALNVTLHCKALRVRHMLKHVPRHLLEHVPKYVPAKQMRERHVPEHILARHMLGHVLGLNIILLLFSREKSLTIKILVLFYMLKLFSRHSVVRCG